MTSFERGETVEYCGQTATFLAVDKLDAFIRFAITGRPAIVHPGDLRKLPKPFAVASLVDGFWQVMIGELLVNFYVHKDHSEMLAQNINAAFAARLESERGKKS